MKKNPFFYILLAIAAAASGASVTYFIHGKNSSSKEITESAPADSVPSVKVRIHDERRSQAISYLELLSTGNVSYQQLALIAQWLQSNQSQARDIMGYYALADAYGAYDNCRRALADLDGAMASERTALQIRKTVSNIPQTAHLTTLCSKMGYFLFDGPRMLEPAETVARIKDFQRAHPNGISSFAEI